MLAIEETRQPMKANVSPNTSWARDFRLSHQPGPNTSQILQRSFGNGYLQAIDQSACMNCAPTILTAEPQVQRACACGGNCGNCGEKEDEPQRLQTKLKISEPGDIYEQEADRVADWVTRRSDSGAPIARWGSMGGLSAMDDEETAVGGVLEQADDERVQLQTIGNRPANHVLPQNPDMQLTDFGDPGQPLHSGQLDFFEPFLGKSLNHVRIHTGTQAATTAEALGARAYTIGSDISFADSQYQPETREGRRLLAHELTHVVQQNSLGKSNTRLPDVQCDLARVPPHPAAVARALTPPEIQAAIRFNEFRFKDPWDIRNVRDVLGLPPVPAIIDEAFVLAVVQWQAEQGLHQDGQVGAETTRTFLLELRAEGEGAKASDLARDNFVTTTTVTAPVFNNCGALPRFRWDVTLNTSLRNGFIIQQIDNVFNPQTCTGAPLALPVASTPTPRYWEAWAVDNLGHVTPLVGGINDRWQRAFPPGSRGNWRMTATFFTVPALPAAAGFAAGAVHDAGILQSTVTQPNPDDLGIAAGRRTIGGTWNCCPPANTHVRN